MDKVIIDGISYAIPLLIIAIGGIYSERSGVTNLALEGLQAFGAFAGGLVFVLIQHNFAAGSSIPIYISLLAAMVGGALFAMIHAILCIYFMTDQVISGVVINLLSTALTGCLTSQINQSVFGGPSDKFMLSVFPSVTVPGLSEIPILGAFFTNLYIFVPILLVLVAYFWYLLYRTKFGMHLRACGDNPQAVAAAGIPVHKVRFIAVLISGALSGIGGMCFAYSISGAFSRAIYAGAGFLAIAALIFGNWQIMPTFGACLIFGFARSGAYELVKVLNLRSSFSDLAMILPYLLTLILLVFFSKNNQPPRALGEIYDKGKR